MPSPDATSRPEAELAEPEPAKLEPTEPEVTEPDVTEPEATEPEIIAPELVEHHTEMQVGLERSVRYGRIITTTIIVGAVLGVLISLLFPVADSAMYELSQVAGLMLVVGGVIGLTVGAALSLVLGAIAKRQRGAAIAVQTDVQTQG